MFTLFPSPETIDIRSSPDSKSWEKKVHSAYALLRYFFFKFLCRHAH